MSNVKPHQLPLDLGRAGGSPIEDTEKLIQRYTRAYEKTRLLCISANADYERIAPLFDAAVAALKDRTNTTEWVELAGVRVTREYAKGLVSRCRGFKSDQCERIGLLEKYRAELERLGFVITLSDAITVEGGC